MLKGLDAINDEPALLLRLSELFGTPIRATAGRRRTCHCSMR